MKDALGSVRQLTDASGVVTLAKAYEPYGQVLDSQGAGASSYGFTGEWTDVNGLVNLRARVYAPSQGRFLTRDSWGGDNQQPISYNKWVYGNTNPIKYTDPSGHTPAIVAALLPSIVGGAAGFLAGAAAGGIYGACVYELALAGQCGCDMQQQALSMTRQDWVSAHALGAGIIGGVGGAIAATGPLGMIVVGGVGIVLSGADIYNTYNIIKNETGLTTCTVTRLILDVATMALGGTGIVQGVRAWRASGSIFDWSSSATINPLKVARLKADIDAELNFPYPPEANYGNSTIGKSAIQNADAQTWVRQVKNLRARDIRVNQEQVNGSGVHVGINKPDLQFTLGKQRYYVEWDTPSSGRAIPHAQRIYANDPSATNILILDYPYQMPNLQGLTEQIILISMP